MISSGLQTKQLCDSLINSNIVLVWKRNRSLKPIELQECTPNSPSSSHKHFNF